MQREALGDGQFRIEVQLVETTAAVIDGVKRLDGVVGVDKYDDRLLINCLSDMRPQIARAIVEAEGQLMQMNPQSFALEDIYRKYFTGGQLV